MMLKGFLPVLLLSILIPSVPSAAETMEHLVLVDGRYHKISSDEPFSGVIEGQSRGFLKNGLKHGAWVYLNESGQVKSRGEYRNGQKHGFWEGFYPNGQLFYKGSFLDGQKQGMWVSHYDDGALFYQGRFDNGKENGPWVGFNPDGSPWAYRTGLFADGVKLKE